MNVGYGNPWKLGCTLATFSTNCCLLDCSPSQQLINIFVDQTTQLGNASSTFDYFDYCWSDEFYFSRSVCHFTFCPLGAFGTYLHP